MYKSLCLLTLYLATSCTTEIWKPIKIYLVRTKSFNDKLKGNDLAYMENILAEMVKFFEHTIAVRPLKKKFDFTGKECGDFLSINTKQTETLDQAKTADLVLMLSASVEDRCSAAGNTLAYAWPCRTASTDERTTVGAIFFCTNNINPTNWNKKSVLSTLIHECMHVLVFHPELLFPKFNDATTGERMKEVVRKEEFQWKVKRSRFLTVNRTLLVSPKVTEAVRTHFNCSTLNGAMLENDGGPGTADCHWEKRLFGHELMIGSQTRKSVFSAMTAALLEDSGWYRVNKSKIQKMAWGRNLGCDFAQKSCFEYISERNTEPMEAFPYCNYRDYALQTIQGHGLTRCSQDRLYFMECGFSKVTNRTINPQAFPDMQELAPRIGPIVSGIGISGDDELTDYCPMWQIIFFGGKYDRKGDSFCSNAGSQPSNKTNFGAEIYGASSICLDQKSMFFRLTCVTPTIFGICGTSFDNRSGAGCYKYVCRDGRLLIYATSMRGINNNAYKICWAKGSLIHLYRYMIIDGEIGLVRGIIKCPSCSEVCETPSSDFRCLPEVRGIDSTDPLLSPCAATGIRINHALFVMSTLFFIVNALD